MWQCSSCRDTHSDLLEVCWRCGAERSRSADENPSPSRKKRLRSRLSVSAMNRREAWVLLLLAVLAYGIWSVSSAPISLPSLIAIVLLGNAATAAVAVLVTWLLLAGTSDWLLTEADFATVLC